MLIKGATAVSVIVHSFHGLYFISLLARHNTEAVALAMQKGSEMYSVWKNGFLCYQCSYLEQKSI